MGRGSVFGSELAGRQTEEAEDTIAWLQEIVEEQGRAAIALEERAAKMEAERNSAVAEIESLKNQNRSLREQLRDCSETVAPEVIDKITGYDMYEVLEKKIWPEKIFKAAFVTRSHPLKSKGMDIIVAASSKVGISQDHKTVNETLYQSFVDRYPAIEGMEGRLSMMTVTTKTEDAEGSRTTDRWILRAEMEDERRDWYSILELAKERMVRGGRGYLAIYPPLPDPEGQKTRKMAESIFRNTGIKVIMFIRGASQKPKRVGGAETRKAKQKRDEEVLILKKEGRTYADLLREVKEAVKPGSKAAEGIRRIRESRKGEMVIVIEKHRKEAVDALKEEIGKDSTATLRGGRGAGKTSMVIIQDIDGLATQEEVLEALVKETGTLWENTRVSNLRKFFGGNQAATVRLPQQVGTALAKIGKIKIGLNECLVKERVDPKLCYRCWAYGHRSNQCVGMDRGGRCMKCGEPEHVARSCSSEKLYCLTCRMEGHTTLSKGCPEFQKALGIERGKLTRDRRPGPPEQKNSRNRTGSEASDSGASPTAGDS